MLQINSPGAPAFPKDELQNFYFNANVASDVFNISDEHFKRLESVSGEAVKTQQEILDKLLDMLVTKH